MIAAPMNVLPSLSPYVLSHWVAASNVPKRRISGETHFFLVTAIDTLRQGWKLTATRAVGDECHKTAARTVGRTVLASQHPNSMWLPRRRSWDTSCGNRGRHSGTRQASALLLFTLSEPFFENRRSKEREGFRTQTAALPQSAESFNEIP